MMDATINTRSPILSINSRVNSPTVAPSPVAPDPGGNRGNSVILPVGLVDDNEGYDVEVMQVVGEALNLRLKKNEQNGSVSCDLNGVQDHEDLNRERPMSWEGELSNDGEEDEMNQVDPPMALTDIPAHRAGGSPMCIQSEKDDSHLPPPNIITKEHKNMLMVGCSNGRRRSRETSPAPVHPLAVESATIQLEVLGNITRFSPNGVSAFSTDRSNSIGITTPLTENSFSSHRQSPAQGRHLSGYNGSMNATGPYSQSPSPVLNRPTSSCSSSRSSYSPTQSPLLSRHTIINNSSTYSHNQSPILSRHHVPGNSSDNSSAYSPTSSPLQGRHVSVDNGNILYSPTQSPSQSRHHLVVVADSSSGNGTNCFSSKGSITPIGSSYSPSHSPAQFRTGSSSSLITKQVTPFGPSPSPTLQRSSAGTPDHSVTTSVGVEGNSIFSMGNSSCSNPPHVVYSSHPASESGINDGRTHKSTVLHQPTILDCRSTTSSASVVSSASDESNASDFSSPSRRLSVDNGSFTDETKALGEISSPSPLGSGNSSSGISRQQLLSGPCPICGDRISGFHYGIFSCESCKGFFKRTVQNKKNYVCLRGAKCTITISTRKKCPACRFDKCLKTGMKLEAIREDRTRGGRSTYQCSYALATQSLSDGRVSSACDSQLSNTSSERLKEGHYSSHSTSLDGASPTRPPSGRNVTDSGINSAEDEPHIGFIPPLMQEILAVEHLWHYTDKEVNRLSEQYTSDRGGAMGAAALGAMGMGSLDSSAGTGSNNNEFLSNLCNIADHRLYKIVKWCKSLPLFREIEIDDQIALLINSWCELLLLSCCYRSMDSPHEIRVSLGKSMTLEQAKKLGLGPVIERMLNLTEHMRRLRLDQYEYVCLKVIILLTSDVSGLREPEKVGVCQKQVLEAMQTYTRIHYPQQPSKFGELLLRIPELERACQVGKESLITSKQKSGDMNSFNLLMELLRGDH